MSGKRRVSAGAVALLLLSVAGCGPETLESVWNDRGITVDGSAAEWDGILRSFDDARGSVGIVNDGNDVFLCFVTRDPAVQRQVLARGLTLWIDPEAKKQKTRGLLFPVGRRERGVGFPPPEGDAPAPDPDAIAERVAEAAGEAEILGPGEEDRVRMPVGDLPEVEVGMAYERGVLAYELRIPRSAGEGVFPALEAGSFGLGLETPEIDRGTRPRRPGGGMGAGRRGPGGGPPGGGMRGGRGRERPEPIRLWATVILAPAPGPSGE